MINLLKVSTRLIGIIQVQEAKTHGEGSTTNGEIVTGDWTLDDAIE